MRGARRARLDARMRTRREGDVMGRTTLALITAVMGITLALTAAAGAATHGTAGTTRWRITDLGTFGPGWTSGSAAAINARGQVVGTNGTASGKQHAFLWQNGKMTDLGTLGGRDSGASAINARGQVVGTSLTAAPQHVHAFLWESGKMRDLGTLGGKSSRPRALNDHGQVVGESFTASGTVHAFLWRNGKMTDLGTLGGSDSFASGINDRGQVVGSSSTANGTQHAFLWQNGKMLDLGTLGARFTSSSATAINGKGEIVGTSYLAKVTQTGQQGHAFLWQYGSMSDLGTLGAGYPTSEAAALNASGEIVGSSRSATGPARPVLWRDGTILPLYRGSSYGAVVAINDRGRVIGARVPPRGAVVHAFVSDNGELTDLGTLGGAESDASALNARNQIVGVSQTRRGARHAVLWTSTQR
jgi:probable HAF family extracellular repeat protein